MINWIQIHLALNHFPIVGSLLAIFLLTFCLFSINLGIIRLSLLVTLLFGISAIPAYYSGIQSEEFAGAIPAINDAQVGRHHEAALITTFLGGIVAVSAALSLGFIGLLHSRRKTLVIIANLIVSISYTASAGYTGHLGGLLRHPELETIPAVSPDSPIDHDSHHHQH